MSLSYSFKTRITSGYFKGTPSAKIETVLEQSILCATIFSHPLLLPVLMLRHEISAKNDSTQRDIRARIRLLDSILNRRYVNQDKRDRQPEDEFTLDGINHALAESHAQVLWKRPQAWKNAVNRMGEALACFWRELPDQAKRPQLEKLHLDLISCLEFITVKLECLEHYASVSQERLSKLRDVVSNKIFVNNVKHTDCCGQSSGITGQVESRLNAEIALQQHRLADASHRLADASKRDSASMKTLALLGSFFLPGTFLSSMFSMPFFDFSHGMMSCPHD